MLCREEKCSFSETVFKGLLLQGPEKSGLCGKDSTLYHKILTFNYVLEEAVYEKRENAGKQHFPLFPLPNHIIIPSCTVKPVLEAICIKRPHLLRDHCSDTTTPLKSTQ